MNNIIAKHRNHYKLPILLICIAAMVILILLATALANAANPAGQSPGKTAPTNSEFAKIRLIVQGYFETLPNYKDGDLIIHKEGEKVIRVLQEAGFTVSDEAAILQKMLTGNSFLAKTLRGNKQGRTFMRQIAQLPLAYDKLDRLAAQPVGRRTVQDLARGPDGYKMLQYMNTPYGKNMGKMLSSKQSGNFNKPTGRIYNAEQLIDAIWKQTGTKK